MLPKIVKNTVINPIWLSISESAKLAGVQAKTIRRAIHAKKLKYRIVNNRYSVDFASLINYMHSNTKLKNKILFSGISQYIKNWRN